MIEKPITSLKGVGEALAIRFQRLGIHHVNDLIEHFPQRYEDRSCLLTINQLCHGVFASFSATVEKGDVQRVRGKTISRLWVRDETGVAVLIWFNQPYRATAWKRGTKVIVYGKVNRFRELLQVESPEVDLADAAELLNSTRIVPIYPLTQGLGARTLRKLIAGALHAEQPLSETLPATIRQKYHLLDRDRAFQEIHFPTDWAAMQAAKRRIVFEELFYLQCALAFLRHQRLDDRRSVRHSPDGAVVQQLQAQLPFGLTKDQQTAYEEIAGDMESTRPMLRLLQGDVGSGKTAVAVLALAKTIENGLQGVLMAPTEILAEQHYATIAPLFRRLGLATALLTGHIKGGQRRELLQSLQTGSIHLLIGTHALLQPDVVFQKLGLVVTDEQHRFGVGQRAMLQEKGEVPHTLVMSATPIPRTMALTLYGDMDVSVIRQLPPGRQPITTAIRSGQAAREKVYKFLVTEAAAGRQGYVVCPLVEDSDKLSAQSATEVFRELTSTFLRGIRCGLLHGRMNAVDKENVMRDFAEGRISVLIATTVIEVGINVPKATMMIIEDADRFGLAQLHQLRGRVGRGSERSFCVLLHDDDVSVIPERLKVLAETNDGFVVAEKDLLLRGPGQFLGYRQHGLPEMKMANLADDCDILDEARQAALEAMNRRIGTDEILPLLQQRFDRFFGVLFAG
ncbi:MAG: ATP-dependent DNA helicase RecG [Veillonellaceae bacterium]|nr:ATP-dependent DNA helicase RecG [Veillonellaceae bacterium]